MPASVIQQIAGVNGSGGSTIVLSPASTAAGSEIVVNVGVNLATATIVGIVDNQLNTYTSVGTISSASLNQQIFKATNATAGVTVITITFSGAVGANAAAASGYELGGIATSSEIGQNSTGSGSETDTGIDLAVTSFTPDVNDSIIISAGRISASTTSWTNDAAYTLGPTLARLGTEYKIRAGAGNETAPIVGNFGASGTRSWVYVAVEFKPPVAAGAVKNLPSLGAG